LPSTASPSGSHVKIPGAGLRMYPARCSSRWLATSAPTGSSFWVRTNRDDMRRAIGVSPQLVRTQIEHYRTRAGRGNPERNAPVSRGDRPPGQRAMCGIGEGRFLTWVGPDSSPGRRELDWWVLCRSPAPVGASGPTGTHRHDESERYEEH